MSLNPDIAESARFTEEQLAKYVIDATKSVFSTMIMMDPSDDYPLKDPIKRFQCSITGMVGFAGIYSGVISIHCPVALALQITSSMLGMECDEVNEDLNDAIGEIANMLGGASSRCFPREGWM